MANNVVDFCKTRDKRYKHKRISVTDRLEYLGMLMFDMPVLPPMVILFELFARYDEVPLIDGHTYQMKESELQLKLDGNWQRTEKTVNDLAILMTGLSSEQWHHIKTSCRRNHLFDFSKALDSLD